MNEPISLDMQRLFPDSPSESTGMVGAHDELFIHAEPIRVPTDVVKGYVGP